MRAPQSTINRLCGTLASVSRRQAAPTVSASAPSEFLASNTRPRTYTKMVALSQRGQLQQGYQTGPAHREAASKQQRSLERGTFIGKEHEVVVMDSPRSRTAG